MTKHACVVDTTGIRRLPSRRVPKSCGCVSVCSCLLVCFGLSSAVLVVVAVLQAMIEAGAAEELPEMTKAVWRYLERTQILSTETSRNSPACQFEEPQMRQTYYRHVSKGGWPFSTSAHGWPISVRHRKLERHDRFRVMYFDACCRLSSTGICVVGLQDCTAEGLKSVLELQSLACIRTGALIALQS